MADVTVVIVCWNSAPLIGGVLDALERQSLQPSRILVIDNGSSDVTDLHRVVAGRARCRLLCMGCNLGFAAANNVGIREAVGSEFVALLNPDAFPEPSWLEELVGTARKYPSAASFGSRLLNRDQPDVIDGSGDCYSIWGLAWRRGHGRPAEAEHLLESSIFAPSAAAALYRREALVEVGGFDEDYFCYIEDVDLGFRLQLAGYGSRYVPSSVAMHIGSATTGGQHSDFSVYHGHRNLVWTYVKNMPGMLFWLFLPLHLILNMFAIAWFASKGRTSLILRAKRDALKGIRRMWGKRRQIQAARKSSVGTILGVLDKRLAITKNRR